MTLIDLDFLSRRRVRNAAEGNRARLLRLAHAWCHDRALADDLVQETLLRALDRAGQLRDAERADAWLAAILANCWRDHLRRQRPDDPLDTLDEAHAALSVEERTPEDEAACNQTVRRVRAAVERLPMGQRQVVTLVDLEDFAYAEVAEILAIPVGTVMSRLCRGRLALKALLAEPAAAQPLLRSVK